MRTRHSLAAQLTTASLLFVLLVQNGFGEAVGTTTYYLMGWDEETIRQSIDRLARLQINRLRVLVYGRNQPRPWGQPVVPMEDFQLHLNPWPAERPDDIENPGFDLTRFNVGHWQKYERLLKYARERDMIVSVIFFIGGQVLPTTRTWDRHSCLSFPA